MNFRYKLERRAMVDGAGRYHPKGSFVLSSEELLGDNYVPVDAGGNVIGPAKLRVPKPAVEDTPAAPQITQVAPPVATPDIPEELPPRAPDFLDAEAQADAAKKPDGNHDGERDTLKSLTKAALGEKLDAAGLHPSRAGYESWHEAGKSPTQKQLVALLLGETTCETIKAEKA